MTDYFDFSDDFWNEEDKEVKKEFKNITLTKEEKNITLTEEEKLLNEAFKIELYNEKYGVL
jgi:hypothetical protein